MSLICRFTFKASLTFNRFKTMDLNFSGFAIICSFEANQLPFWAWCSSSLTRLCNDSAAAESVLSSAKLWRIDVMKRNISLIKMLNSKDPNSEPCGTPAKITLSKLIMPFILTLCLRSFRYE